MSKKRPTFEELVKLAEVYGVSGNVLFISASARYAEQAEMVAEIREEIRQTGLMIEHRNVKGDINQDVNPLVSQLPKYNEVANKTLSLMLDIIQRLGTPPTDEGLTGFEC